VRDAISGGEVDMVAIRKPGCSCLLIALYIRKTTIARLSGCNNVSTSTTTPMLPEWSQGPRTRARFSGPSRSPTTITLPSLGGRCTAGRGIDGILCLGALYIR